ncbi:MAG TPA: hypothetical protein VE911_12245 [Candidatus Nitrosopolaris sp.]|nr:hypothetical protein [Candidatus Nitrosopolaris sp.]
MNIPRSLGRLAVTAGALVFGGCATILVGPSQKISITSEPTGSRATVLPEAIELVTPAEAKLARNRTHTVRFEHEGFRTTMGYLDYRPGGAVWGNLVLGGVIGMLVDQSSGSAFILEPDPLHVVLLPLAPVDPSPPAR